MQALRTGNPQDAYIRQKIMTASPVELIVMLFEGLKKDMFQAQRAIRKNDMENAKLKIMHAQDIVAELASSLDLNVEMSADLLDIYEFVIIELESVFNNKDADKLDALMEIAGTFKDTWNEIQAQQTPGGLELVE